MPTGNGKKLSCSQAQLGWATGLAVASFFSFPVGHPMSAGCRTFFSLRSASAVSEWGVWLWAQTAAAVVDDENETRSAINVAFKL